MSRSFVRKGGVLFSFSFHVSCWTLRSLERTDRGKIFTIDGNERRLNYFALKFLIFLSKHIFSIRSIRGKN